MIDFTASHVIYHKNIAGKGFLPLMAGTSVGSSVTIVGAETGSFAEHSSYGDNKIRTSWYS